MTATTISTTARSSGKKVLEVTLRPADGTLEVGVVDKVVRDNLAPVNPPATSSLFAFPGSIVPQLPTITYMLTVDFDTGVLQIIRDNIVISDTTDPAIVGLLSYAFIQIVAPAQSPSQLSVNFGLQAFVNDVPPGAVAWGAEFSALVFESTTADDSTHVIRDTEEKLGEGLFDALLATEAARSEAGRNYLDLVSKDKEIYQIKAIPDVPHSLGDIIFFANYSLAEEFRGKIKGFTYSETRTDKTLSLTVERNIEGCDSGN